MIIENTSSAPVTLLKKAKDQDALIALPDTIRLQANEKKMFFLKYLGTKGLLQEISRTFTTIYTFGKEQYAASFTVIAPSVARISITSFTPINYLDPKSHKVQLNIICRNVGNQALNFKVVSQSYPEGLVLETPVQNLFLQPGDKQSLSLSFRNTLSAKLSTDFQVTLLVIGIDDKTLTSYSIKITQLGSDKQIAMGNNIYAGLLNNSTILNFWNSNNNDSYLQVSANGNVNWKENAQLDYRLNLNYHFKPTTGKDFYDSWAQYGNKNFSFKLGSINENVDYPMYGQGVQFTTNINEHNSIDAIYLKQNYLIYSDLNSQPQGSDIYGLHYQFHEKQRQIASANYIFSKDPLTGLKTNLINGTWFIPTKGQQQLFVEAGSSLEFLSETPDSKRKLGGAVGINYSNNFQKWSIQSNNYYSSPYYGGIRRGAILFNNRLSRAFAKNWNGFVSFAVNHNEPKYLINKNYFSSGSTKNDTYALGASKQFENLSFTLRPYLFTQKLSQPVIGGNFKTSSIAVNSELTTIIQLNMQQIVLVTDFGRVNSNNPYLHNEFYNHWNLMGSYYREHFGFNVIIQHNPYYLIEEPQILNKAPYRRYSLGPNAQLNALNNKLHLTISDYASYNSYIGHWYNAAQGDINMELSPTWSLGGAILLNSYQGEYDQSFLQTRLTIEKKFLQKSAPGNHRLKAAFFDDVNANGNWDAGELPISDIVVRVDQTTAISNKKGTITLSNLSPKTYSLQIVDGNKWSYEKGTPSIEFNMRQNLKMMIPMIQTVLVEGRVVGEENKYTHQLPSLEGIRIVATSAGIEHQSTLTDEKGYFQFYLPKKTFLISLDATGLNFSVTGSAAKKVQVSGDSTPEITFKILDQSRKVDIQQF